MDSITQAALGASIGQLTLGKKLGTKRATVLGAIIGSIPDFDVFLLPFFSEIQRISIHRGYSHSILFCIVAALFLSLILTKVYKNYTVTFFRFYLFTILTLLTHVILDAFTTYGTQLFLPFTDWRVSFDSISVIDPVYTIPLLAGVLLSIFLKNKVSWNAEILNVTGLTLSSLYLLFTLANKEYIEKTFESQLQKSGTLDYELLTVPVSLGNVVWYGVAKNDESLILGRYSLLKSNEIEFHTFPINDDLLEGIDSELVQKLRWIAQDFYVVAENEGKIRIYNMQCDMQGIRYYGNYKAPTAFYYEIEPLGSGEYNLSSGMHEKKNP